MFRRKVKISIEQSAKTRIHGIAEAAAPNETGGILLGWWTKNGIVVESAIEVHDPAATGTSWARHEDTAQAALHAELGRLDHPWLGYVGDWHSHPATVGASGVDLASLVRASRQYKSPLALVVHQPGGQFDVRVAKQGNVRRVELT